MLEPVVITNSMPDLPQPEGWGWTGTAEGAWNVLWSKLPEASKVCRELLYAVVARKAAEQIANARKLHCPAQLYASVLAHASNHIELI